ncbi:MAG: HD domain-containing protein [Deltaproteobacteria bacterium]|nr:HD domain-containing protein [Deltaproteobacteria bacterium]
MLGAALHDCGKLLHPAEMSAAGHAHEASGRRMLETAGFHDEVARAAVTHAQWDRPPAELEDRLIALADKLWKGKRDTELEAHLLNELAESTGKAAWEVFGVLDELCERIAADGPERLRRSNVSTR